MIWQAKRGMLLYGEFSAASVLYNSEPGRIRELVMAGMAIAGVQHPHGVFQSIPAIENPNVSAEDFINAWASHWTIAPAVAHEALEDVRQMVSQVMLTRPCHPDNARLL